MVSYIYHQSVDMKVRCIYNSETHMCCLIPVEVFEEASDYGNREETMKSTKFSFKA